MPRHGRSRRDGGARAGLVLVVVGPDGAGKSSVADALAEHLRSEFRTVHRYHWRPMLLPRPGDLRRGGAAGDAADPHAQPSHPASLSWLLLIYYWLDFLLGHLLRIRPAVARGEAVLVERGWFDMAVDPRRYRLTVPAAAVRRLGALLPRADLRVALDASAATLHARKPELPPEELDRQLAAWRHLAANRPDTALVDAERPLEDVVADVAARLRGDLTARAWIGVPRPSRPRLWVPADDVRASQQGLSLYQPSARTARAALSTVRAGAVVGVLRLASPLRAPLPAEVASLLSPHVPADGTVALMRTNHPGRFTARILDGRARPTAHAKLVTGAGDAAPLSREVAALSGLADRLDGAVRAPRLLEWDGAVLLTEAFSPGARHAPHTLPPRVAADIGRWWRRTGGAVHGDLAPWNLLRLVDGWGVVDWEHARDTGSPYHDVLHFLVQAYAHLGRPNARALLEGVRTGTGAVGTALRAHAEGADVPPPGPADLRAHLLAPNPVLVPRDDGRIEGHEPRAALLQALA